MDRLVFAVLTLAIATTSCNPRRHGSTAQSAAGDAKLIANFPANAQTTYSDIFAFGYNNNGTQIAWVLEAPVLHGSDALSQVMTNVFIAPGAVGETQQSGLQMPDRSNSLDSVEASLQAQMHAYKFLGDYIDEQKDYLGQLNTALAEFSRIPSRETDRKQLASQVGGQLAELAKIPAATDGVPGVQAALQPLTDTGSKPTHAYDSLVNACATTLDAAITSAQTDLYDTTVRRLLSLTTNLHTRNLALAALSVRHTGGLLRELPLDKAIALALAIGTDPETAADFSDEHLAINYLNLLAKAGRPSKLLLTALILLREDSVDATSMSTAPNVVVAKAAAGDELWLRARIFDIRRARLTHPSSDTDLGAELDTEINTLANAT